MNRIDRISAILIHLQTKKFVTAHEIADRFGTSIRTIYRDIRTLEEAGIPLGAETGKGYFIVDGFHLPPVMFSKDEASAMLMAEKMVERFTDDSVSRNFHSAMFKIKSLLPDAEKQYVDTLYQNIEVFYGFQLPNTEFPNNYLSEIQRALANKFTMEMEYQSLYKDEITSNRMIEPVGLCFYSLNWHLIAFCNLRNEYRDFRVDRIRKLVVTGQKIVRKKELSVRQYFKNMTQGE